MAHLVTVFGGTGFIGRHLVRALVADGARVRIVARRAGAAEPPAGAEAVAGSITEPATVEAAVAGAWAVVNLVGILAERGAQTYRAVHAEAPRAVAAAARAAGAEVVVHLSAMAVAADAPAAADRSKAAGERALLAAFPQATVVRPSLVYGPGDHFFTGLAALARTAPTIPLVGGGRTRFQPLAVADMTAALVAVLARSGARGRIYEAAGPATYSLRALVELACAEAGARPWLVPLPFAAAEALGAALQWLPRPPLTRDQVRLLRTDKVASGRHATLADLCIVPQSLHSRRLNYLRSGRTGDDDPR